MCLIKNKLWAYYILMVWNNETYNYYNYWDIIIYTKPIYKSNFCLAKHRLKRLQLLILLRQKKISINEKYDAACNKTGLIGITSRVTKNHDDGQYNHTRVVRNRPMVKAARWRVYREKKRGQPTIDVASTKIIATAVLPWLPINIRGKARGSVTKIHRAPCRTRQVPRNYSRH